MRKLVLVILISCFVNAISHAQHVYKIKTDSLLVTNDSCTAELNLENSTKFVNGFLYNKGKGRTEFRRAMIKITDSTYRFGDDTLNFRSLLNTIGFSGTNIYNSNGALTSDRSLTLGSYSMSIKQGGNTIEHTFANGNKWFGNGTPTDAGHKIDVNGTAIFRSTTWLPTARFDASGIQFHRSKFVISDYGDYFDLDPGSSFTFKMNNTNAYILKMQENAISFRSTENYAGNLGASMEFRFINMNTFQMNPLLPNGYAQGLTVSLHGGTGGNWENVDNRGIPGKLILNGGSAQSNANTLNAAAGNIEVNGGMGTGNGTGGDILFSTSTALSSGTTLQTLSERLRIKYNTGNVLIGTSTDAGYKMDVNGTARIQENLTVGSTTNTIITSPGTTGQDPNITLLKSGTTQYRIGSGSFGTSYMTGGGFVLDNTAGSFHNLRVAGLLSTVVEATSGHIYIDGTGDNALHFVHSGVNTRGLIGYAANSGTMQIRVNASTDFTNGTLSTSFFNNGNVSIGNSTDDGHKLDVNGTGRIQGLLTASSIYSKGYNSYSIDYVNTGNKVFEAGFGSNNTVLYVSHGSIGQSWRVAQFNTSGGTINFNNGPGATNQEKSALIEMTSTQQGFLPSRMTGAQAEAISSPAEGLMIYATNGNGTVITSKGWWGFNGTTWEKLNN